MASIVLTVIGDDRAGLVAALAEVVKTHGGNWERSQMTELAGKFAGIVVVTAAQDHIAPMTDALRELDGLLDVAVYSGAIESDPTDWTRVGLEVIGNDQPGIVRELSAVLSKHGLSIDTMNTQTREAPMVGGLLFEAQFEVRIPPEFEVAELRSDLERLAGELFVDVNFRDKLAQ